MKKILIFSVITLLATGCLSTQLNSISKPNTPSTSEIPKQPRQNNLVNSNLTPQGEISNPQQKPIAAKPQVQDCGFVPKDKLKIDIASGEIKDPDYKKAVACFSRALLNCSMAKYSETREDGQTYYYNITNRTNVSCVVKVGPPYYSCTIPQTLIDNLKTHSAENLDVAFLPFQFMISFHLSGAKEEPPSGIVCTSTN